jgi:hypothetical protein
LVNFGNRSHAFSHRDTLLDNSARLKRVQHRQTINRQANRQTEVLGWPFVISITNLSLSNILSSMVTISPN